MSFLKSLSLSFARRTNRHNWTIWTKCAFCGVLTATFAALSGCSPTSQNDVEGNANVSTVDVPVSPTVPRRIVSTVPSVTETLCALGVGDSLVAVSSFCQYPPEVAKLPKIGSLYDLDVESIVELEPDFVVLLAENDEARRRLETLGVETVAVDHSSLDGVLESFETLGRRCGEAAARRGGELRRETSARIDAIRRSVDGLPKPRVLISIDRTPGIGKISDVFVAAQNPYFNSALEIVGATNAASELLGAVPTVGPEGAIALNPEVVVDLSTDGVYRDDAATEAKIAENRADWNSLGDVAAVRDGRVYPILDVYATVPGPRTVLFLERLADLIHPERAERNAGSNDVPPSEPASEPAR